jgi:hypothetical protein
MFACDEAVAERYPTIRAGIIHHDSPPPSRDPGLTGLDWLTCNIKEVLNHFANCSKSRFQ